MCCSAQASTTRSASTDGRSKSTWPAAWSGDGRPFRNHGATTFALSHAAAAPEHSDGVNNLLVAGRCASMTHDGQSAARVSGACFVMGQAAGTAAALACNSGRSLYDADIKDLQRVLVEQGAFLGRDQKVPEGL